MEDTKAWGQLAHAMVRLAEPLLEDPTAFVIWEVRPGADDFVQWHGEPGRELYAEASSRLYGEDSGDLALPDAVQLRRLCWDAPGAGWGGDAVWNWSRRWRAPVDLYAFVLHTVRTLRDVYAADPREVVTA